MIIDHIRNASLHGRGDAGIRAALDYLAGTDFSAIEPGRYALDGERIYAMVQQYETKPLEGALWEAHRRYIDVQYIVSGVERMGYAPLDKLAVTVPYAEEKDALRLTGKGDLLTLSPGMFAVLYPHDAHLPGLMADAQASTVRKVVVKVAVGA